MTVPRHALRFVGHAAQLARTYGLRKGIGLAARAVNPAFLALEAATSVLGAVQSFSSLNEARTVRDGLERQSALLRKEVETLRKRLDAEREALGHQVTVAREREAHNAEIRHLINAIARDCMSLLTASFHAVNDLHDEDIPDLAAIDAAGRRLVRAQRDFLNALSAIQSTPDP